jgi:hypothetical protein
MISGEPRSDSRIFPSREGDGGYCDAGLERTPDVDGGEQQKQDCLAKIQELDRLGIKDEVSFALDGDRNWGSGSKRWRDGVDRPGDLGDISALDLTLSQDKRLEDLVQQEIVTAHSVQHEGEIRSIETVAFSAIPLIRATNCAGS